jgi:hypothetical protein
MQFQARLLDLLHAKASATVLSSGAPARLSATLSSASMGGVRRASRCAPGA